MFSFSRTQRGAAEVENGGETSFSPRTTSLTVQRYNARKDTSEETFFTKLEQEVVKVGEDACCACWNARVHP